MSSGSGPTKTFKYGLNMEETATPGVFKVQSSFSGTDFILNDKPDLGSDNLSQLGDISNDGFTALGPNRQSPLDNMTYYGMTADGKGIIGQTPSKNQTPTYFLYSDTKYGGFGTYVTGAVKQPFALCFGSGTRIGTARGDVAVEDLRVGDRAVTAGGAQRTITWIGHRRIDGRGQPLATDQSPVRVRAGAFGPGLPARDLQLSPGHPVLVGADADHDGGVLVPVMCLINGTTIARVVSEAVTYWHVELESHDILLAEGLPAESYLDLGCRAFFEDGSDAVLHNPDLVASGVAGRCRPVALDGPLVEAERARLDTVFAAALNAHCVWVDDDDLSAQDVPRVPSVPGHRATRAA